MSRNFTREGFYELVWSKPMTHLAKDFALSDVALHKICRKHGIPTPPAGWWAKKAAGKPVERIPLPAVKTGQVGARITIAAGNLGNEPEAVAVARERARVIASAVDADLGTPRHGVVTETLKALRRAGAAGLEGLVTVSGGGVVKTAVAPASFERVELILARLAAAGAATDVEMAADEKGAFFRRDEVIVRFSISESYRRHKHVLTEPEQAKLAAWEKRHEKVLRRGGWEALMLPDRPRFAEWDYAPTGLLSLEMEAPYLYRGSPRRSFRDAKIQRLEMMAADIVVGVHVLAAAMKEDLRRREEVERQRREAQERRERALRERHILERRDAALGDLLQQVEELDRLRRLVASLEAELRGGAHGRVGRFITFARARLEEQEQALQTEGLSARFETERLFGDDDDHDFRAPVYGY